MASRVLYAQLKNYIVQQIATGTWRPDELLPSQRQLAQQHDMSHMTVRRAINELMSEGYLYSVPGKGTYVATSQDKKEAESGIFVSFTEDMASRGLTASSKILDRSLIEAPVSLARMFEQPPGTPIYRLHRLRFANDEAIAVQTTYLLASRVPGLLTYDFSSDSLYRVLRSDYQVVFDSGEQWVEAGLADAEYAALLGLEIPAALLITEQISRENRGSVIEFVRSAYHADRYKMRINRT